MTDTLLQEGQFAADSVLGLSSFSFSDTAQVRWTFDVIENPAGFVASILTDDGSDALRALITETKAFQIFPIQVPAGTCIFQVESQGGTVRARSYAIYLISPDEPDSESGSPGDNNSSGTDPSDDDSFPDLTDDVDHPLKVIDPKRKDG